MAVYVDDMWRYPIGCYGRMKMSHMAADSLDELLDMADRIGVAARHLQKPPRASWVHFDISLERRIRAVHHGAIEITMREMVAYDWHRRTKERTVPPSVAMRAWQQHMESIDAKRRATRNAFPAKIRRRDGSDSD